MVLGCTEPVDIPRFFVEAKPDSLHEAIFAWEDTCGVTDRSTRTLILASIWDDAFTEDLYGHEIMDFLIAEARRTEVNDFDLFSAGVADQLLPHVPPDTPEFFFCLFYSGRTQEAWALLADETLAGTYLQRQYEWEQERISLESQPTTVIVTAGYWAPEGNLALAGNHANVGLMAEKRQDRLFWRAAGDILIGRAKSPYRVESRRSDRFNAVALMLEAGGNVWRGFDLYAGGGAEGTIAFLGNEEEDSQMLVNWKALIGLGYRRDMGRWFAGLDLRREWMTDRNGQGTPLDGQAWSWRVGVGINPNHDLDQRLRALEP